MLATSASSSSRAAARGLLARRDTHRLCASCIRRLHGGQARHVESPAAALAKQYFWRNDVWPRAEGGRAATLDTGRRSARDGVVESTARPAQDSPLMRRQAPARDSLVGQTQPPTEDPVLPHRRRRRRKALAQEEETPQDDTQETPLPLDASSQLSTVASSSRANSFRQQFYAYLALSKPRLTALIALTTTASYSLYPVAVSPFAAHLSLSPLTLLTLTAGTALASASANALNMLFEPQHDAKMSRTRARPLVRGLLTPRAALAFAVLAGAAGTALLYAGVNPTVAGLGALNIALYAGVYTPLKRLSVLNTWVGALVGGIPPLMGWAAAAGQASSPGAGWRDLLFAPDGSSAGGWLLAGLLFAWQFPHFWALAYPIRGEYAAAGYRMLVGSNVRMAGRSALRYSLAMFPLCVGLSAVGVTGWWFVVASAGVNGWMAREAWRFWRLEGAKGSARGLFWASVWHLPIVLVLAMVAKRGMWERVVWGGLDAEELRMWAAAEEDDEQDDRREKR